MPWTKASVAALGLGAALFIGGVAAAETIVVRSSGPSAGAYPPGRAIGDNRKLALKAGDTIIILDGRGTRTLRGPGVFDTTAGASTNSTNSTVGTLLRNTGTRQVRTGAVRGAGTAQGTIRSPNIWFVDVSKSATVCLADAGNVSLWRADTSAEQKLTVAGGGKSLSFDWAKGMSVKVWPTDQMPVVAGTQYTISGTGMAAPTTLKFALLGPNPQGLEGTAAALIQNGCNTQLDLLIETVALPGEPQG